MQIMNLFVRRDYLENKVVRAENDVRNVCYCCKFCGKCEKLYALKSELKKKGFNSFNKNVLFWNVYKDRFRIEQLPLDLRF